MIEKPEQNSAAPTPEGVDAMEWERVGRLFEVEAANAELWKALLAADLTAAQSALDSGASVNDLSGRGWSRGDAPLMYAVFFDEAKTTLWLLERGANPNIVNKRGQTPLHCAAGGGSAACVSLLLNAGADASARDQRGGLPIHEAARGDSEACVRLLAASGSPLDEIAFDWGSPMHQAALAESAAVCSALFELGASARIKNYAGRSPRQAALEKVKRGDVKIHAKHQAAVDILEALEEAEVIREAMGSAPQSKTSRSL